MSERLITLARVLGSVALTVVGIFSVEMPDAYLGPSDELTQFGATYAVLLAFAAVFVAVAVWRGMRAGTHGAAVLFSGNVGLFVPALVSDPLIAASVILWHLGLLAFHLLPARRPFGAPVEHTRLPSVENLERWWADYGASLRHLVIVSLVLTVAVIGFRVSLDWEVLLVCLALNAVSAVVSARFLWLMFAAGHRAVSVVALVLVAATATLFEPSMALAFFAVFQALMFAVLVARGPAFSELTSAFFDSPALLIVVSFATAIIVGTILLSFPAASATGEPIALLDALFTATSAVCVTGLIVLDTPVAFSSFGHGVILALIQVGGLGIMVLSTFGALIVGGRLGLRGEHALGKVLDIRHPGRAYRLTRFIVLSTLSIEAIGAACLSLGFRHQGLAWGEAVWKGVFHAISAFCNAGFALQSDSVVLFQDQPLVLLVFMALITLGGLGFLVLSGLWSTWFEPEQSQWGVQVKVVLSATALLVLVGWGLYLAVEWNATLAHLDPFDRVVNALFQSVTLRTAGFNSVDFGGLHMATVLFMLAFMYVGASPGSTGGGIKTTTAVVLLSGIRAIAKGEPRIVLFGRRISQDIVYRSAAIAVIAVMIVGGGFFLLLLTEDLGFETLLFEMVSAMGTVGLSLGATSELSEAGKVIIVCVMFAGRVGPLTLALLLGGGKPSPVHYPRARMMVG